MTYRLLRSAPVSPLIAIFVVLVLLVPLSPAIQSETDISGTDAIEIVPPRIIQNPVRAANAQGLLFYESEYDLAIGDKGEEAFNLSVKKPGCGEEALVFHDARLVYKKRRFGEAKILNKPPSGCFNCPPLTVGWYHEPTGFVSFQVHVYRKRVAGQCH